MKKKVLCSLFLVITLLLTSLPVFSLWTFDVLDVGFYSVINGYENPATGLLSGTMRAKVKFSNMTNEDYSVSLYLCTKDSMTGRLKSLNAEDFTIPASLPTAVYDIDVTVSDNTNEDLFLYVWDENNVPLCEPVFLESTETFENSFKVSAQVTSTYKRDSLLSEGGVGKVRLELSETPDNEELEEYKNYAEFSYTEGSSYRFVVPEGDTFASYYLNCHVMAELAPDETGALEIKSIYPDTQRSNILTVSKDIEYADIDDSTGLITFEYWQDNNDVSAPTSVNIKSDATIWLNGERRNSTDVESAFESLDSDLFNGYVQFVGLKGEAFDTILITEYSYALVVYVDLDYEALDCDNGYIELGADARVSDFIYNIYKEGKKISLADIQEDDVISVVVPGGDIDAASSLDIFVSSNKIEGSVTTATGNSCYIDNVEYKTTGISLTVGTEGTFLITHDGKIYDVITDSAKFGDYGFILRVGTTEDYFENTYQLKLLTADGSVQDYEIAPTINVLAEIDGYIGTYTFKSIDGSQDEIFAENGSYYYNIPTLLLADTEEMAQAKAALRLIRYKLSDEGKICQITFASASGVDGEDYNIKSITAGSYKKSTGRLDRYFFGDNTILLYAPIISFDETSWEVDITDVALISRSMLDEDTLYTAYAYETVDRVMGATMIVSELGFACKSNALAIVTDIDTDLNADGEPVTLITLFQSGATEIYTVGENVYTLDEVSPGDIIQYTLGINNEIYQAEVVYNGALTDYADLITSGESDIEFVAGYVVDNYNGAVILNDNYEYSTGIEYTFYTNDTSTLAMAKESAAGTSDYVTKVTSPEAFKYTNTMSSNPIVYYMVARLVDGEIVDAVEYNLGQIY